MPAYQFCLLNASKDFLNNESIETSLDGIVYEFSVELTLMTI